MHGKRRPIQTPLVPRRVIAVVEELVARVTLPRRIVVVLVSDWVYARKYECGAVAGPGSTGSRVSGCPAATTRRHLSRRMWIR